jgi:hypothetical protein
MKIIIIIFMSMITTIFYAQSAEELESFNNVNNNDVLGAIPSLAGKDYFIWEAIEGQIAVISKINSIYTYYNLQLGRLSGATIVNTKTLNYKPVLDKIFTNFVPKAGVKRYLSDYGLGSNEHILGTVYFAIYKNGVKTFDYCLPQLLQSNSKESPIDEEILTFLLVDLLVNLDKLTSITYTNTVKSGRYTRNDCGRGTGSSVTYTVPAGKYTSTISQADADAQAQADVTKNGQSYANTNGTCKTGPKGNTFEP